MFKSFLSGVIFGALIFTPAITKAGDASQRHVNPFVAMKILEGILCGDSTECKAMESCHFFAYSKDGKKKILYDIVVIEINMNGRGNFVVSDSNTGAKFNDEQRDGILDSVSIPGFTEGFQSLDKFDVESKANTLEAYAQRLDMMLFDCDRSPMSYVHTI